MQVVRTINPHGDALARLTHQFRNVRGPEQLNQCLKAWGLGGEVSPKQARFWAESTDTEKQVFCDVAKVSRNYTRQDWRHIGPSERAKLWKAITEVTTWGERLKGRF